MRIIEVCFVLQDGPSDSNNIRILQYLPPYVSPLRSSWTRKLTSNSGSPVACVRRVSSLERDRPFSFSDLSYSTMFMSATDEEMRRADGLGIDHVTYALFVSVYPRLVQRSTDRHVL